jgi:hypothetical protein
MAFGFIGDIVEGIGDVLLPKGTRGATLGALGGAVLGGDPLKGAAYGASISSQLSGKSAVSAPTATQSPQFAPETSVSSMGPNVYRGNGYMPTYTAGFRGFPSTTTTGAGAGAIAGEIMDLIPDINISKYFGGSAVCATKPSGAPITIRPDGCITVSRKQQAKLKVMVQTIGLQAVADALNLSEGEVAALLLKNFPRRGKGITAAQLRNAKRVNRTIMGMAKQLQDACKTTTRRR